jgi:hypothetical protein
LKWHKQCGDYDLLFQIKDYIEDEDCEEIFLASIVYQLANDIELARTHNSFKPRRSKNLLRDW